MAVKKQLNNEDRDVIHEFFEVAKEEYGGIDRLFATPLSFSDEGGIVKFRFPKWMEGIQQYLITHYGFKDAGRLMLELMAEWIADGRFRRIPNFKSEVSEAQDASYNEPLLKQNLSY